MTAPSEIVRGGALAPLSGTGSAGETTSMVANATALPFTRQSMSLPPMTRDAKILASTLDAEERTVDVVWSRGERVLRGGYYTEPYYEELDMSRVRLDRLNGGAPFLDNHNRWSVDAVLGAFVRGSARVEDGAGKGRVKFSKRARAQEVLEDVRDEILNDISAGYYVYEYTEVGRADDGLLILRATDWEPYESSVAPVGAERDTGFEGRSKHQETVQCVVVRSAPQQVPEHQRGEAQMDPNATNTTDTDDAAAKHAAAMEKVREQAAAEARVAEQKRSSTILTRASELRAAGVDLPQAFVDALVAEGRSVEDAMTAMLKHAGEASQKEREEKNKERAAATDAANIAGQAPAGGADTKQRALWDGALEYLLYRANPEKYEYTEKARLWRGQGTQDIAKWAVESRGIETRGRGREEIAMLALRRATYGQRDFVGQGIDNFPALLGELTEKFLLDGYGEVRSPWRQACMRTTVNDLKAKNLLRLSDLPSPDVVNEKGEYTRAQLTESKEQVQVVKRGFIVAMSLEAIMQDELGAFTTVPAKFGRAARDAEDENFYFVLDSNPLMKTDGAVMFSAGRGNLINPGTAADLAGLQAIRKTQRQQKKLNGKRIKANPKFGFFPDKYELTVHQILESIGKDVDSSASRVPSYLGGFIPIISTELDELNTQRWYTFTDPNDAPAFVYAELAGEASVQVFNKEGWDIDGQEMKLRHWHGLAPLDPAAAIRNDGV